MTWPDNYHMRQFNMATVEWNWRCSCLNEPCLGPRDWSPKIMVAIEDLRTLEGRVPKHMLLTKEAALAAPPLIRDPILAGTAFVVKVRNTHEVVYVCPKGLVMMSGYMMAVFEGAWGSVEEGLAMEVKGIGDSPRR